jgi:hypothetical protein
MDTLPSFLLRRHPPFSEKNSHHCSQKHFEHFWKKTLDSGDAGKD